MGLPWIALGIVVFGLLGVAGLEIRRKQMRRWLVPYLRDLTRRRGRNPGEPMDVLICIADHYEPKAYGADRETGLRRVRTWVDAYPKQFQRFRDSDGRPPRYSFFFPAEEYEPEYLDLLADLCRQGFGEVEVHLHHDGDAAENFRKTLESFRAILSDRHGLLATDRRTGEIRYGFIHGNWALCNSRPDGRYCGVDSELAILKETGCFVDMTFPSAPDVTQPPILNRIYYAADCPGNSASHEHVRPVENGKPGPNDLMMIQGPLLLDWRRRKWGLLPRLENGCLQATQPPSLARLATWIKARVGVPARPDWVFVKLHAHGAPEDAHDVLLGDPMVRFHEELARYAAEDPNFRYHYVTAREMYNLARAAESGYAGPVAGALDYEIVSRIASVDASQG